MQTFDLIADIPLCNLTASDFTICISLILPFISLALSIYACYKENLDRIDNIILNLIQKNKLQNEDISEKFPQINDNFEIYSTQYTGDKVFIMINNIHALIMESFKEFCPPAKYSTICIDEEIEALESDMEKKMLTGYERKEKYIELRQRYYLSLLYEFYSLHPLFEKFREMPEKERRKILADRMACKHADISKSYVSYNQLKDLLKSNYPQKNLFKYARGKLMNRLLSHSVLPHQICFFELLEL